MARRTISGIRNDARPKGRQDRQGTREHLLEAAGQVFAEKGFERSTAKEICERADTNTAAVNYYFGGIEALYTAVVEEARNRVFSIQAIGQAIEGKASPKAKLEAAVGVLVQTLLGPVSSSWELRLLGRDMVTHSPTADAAKEKLVLPRVRILRRFIGELIDLPEDHPAVARACITLIAPLCLLVLGDRRMMKRALPNLGLTPDDAPVLAQHLVHYAMAGLEATGRRARRES